MDLTTDLQEEAAAMDSAKTSDASETSAEEEVREGVAEAVGMAPAAAGEEDPVGEGMPTGTLETLREALVSGNWGLAHAVSVAAAGCGHVGALDESVARTASRAGRMAHPALNADPLRLDEIAGETLAAADAAASAADAGTAEAAACALLPAAIELAAFHPYTGAHVAVERLASACPGRPRGGPRHRRRAGGDGARGRPLRIRGLRRGRGDVRSAGEARRRRPAGPRRRGKLRLHVLLLRADEPHPARHAEPRPAPWGGCAASPPRRSRATTWPASRSPRPPRKWRRPSRTMGGWPPPSARSTPSAPTRSHAEIAGPARKKAFAHLGAIAEAARGIVEAAAGRGGDRDATRTAEAVGRLRVELARLTTALTGRAAEDGTAAAALAASRLGVLADALQGVRPVRPTTADRDAEDAHLEAAVAAIPGIVLESGMRFPRNPPAETLRLLVEWGRRAERARRAGRGRGASSPSVACWTRGKPRARTSPRGGAT